MKKIGDFTADLRLTWLAVLAIPIGTVCAFVALLLQRLIGFFTILFYYQRFVISTDLVGMVTRSNLLETWGTAAMKTGRDGVTDAHPIITYDLIDREPITVNPWESCRTAAERMAQARVGRLPVVEPHHRTRVIGMVTRSDLLKPRARHVEEEVQRERFLGRWLGAFDRQGGGAAGTS
jgi:CBS domain-containing protein